MLRVCIRAETSRSVASSSSVNRTAMKRRLLVVAEAILGARPFVAGPRFMLSSLACWYCWSNPTLACLSTVRLSVTPRELPAGARRSGCAPGRSIVLGKARWVSHQLPAISLWLSAVGCMVLFGSISMLGRRVVRTPLLPPPGYPCASALPVDLRHNNFSLQQK